MEKFEIDMLNCYDIFYDDIELYMNDGDVEQKEVTRRIDFARNFLLHAPDNYAKRILEKQKELKRVIKQTNIFNKNEVNKKKESVEKLCSELNKNIKTKYWYDFLDSHDERWVFSIFEELEYIDEIVTNQILKYKLYDTLALHGCFMDKGLYKELCKFFTSAKTDVTYYESEHENYDYGD
jgi:hypothetical protein